MGVFDLGNTNLTLRLPFEDPALLGSVDAALSNATTIRIFHATTAPFPDNPIVAQLGVDNIRAVPEPGAATLVAFALGAPGRRRA